MHHNTKDETGNKYGRLKVVEYVEDDKSLASWLCKCDCGKETVVAGASLRSGQTSSCGCLQKEKSSENASGYSGKNNPGYSHGDTGKRFYENYLDMHKRCSNKRYKNYPRYGGRGIECKWNNYLNFKEDMHESYREHIKKHGKENTTIDRIDNDGNYCKENCRWATRKKQARNTSSNVFLEYEGEKKCLSAWSESTGISVSLLKWRLDHWTVERALTEPVNN